MTLTIIALFSIMGGCETIETYVNSKLNAELRGSGCPRFIVTQIGIGVRDKNTKSSVLGKIEYPELYLIREGWYQPYDIKDLTIDGRPIPLPVYYSDDMQFEEIEPGTHTVSWTCVLHWYGRAPINAGKPVITRTFSEDIEFKNHTVYFIQTWHTQRETGRPVWDEWQRKEAGAYPGDKMIEYEVSLYSKITGVPN